MGLLGVLAIPVFASMGIAFRHLGSSIRLRKGERERGEITYWNPVGRFMDEHTYPVAFTAIGTGLLIAAVWTILGHR
jgi:hypothetical protein